MCACAFSFIAFFGVVKMHSAGMFGGGKRRTLVNEENPDQMEWDDTALNIIENPLETLQVC